VALPAELPETVTLSPVSPSAILTVPELLILPVRANVPETAFKVPPVLIVRSPFRLLLLNEVVEPLSITVAEITSTVLFRAPTRLKLPASYCSV